MNLKNLILSFFIFYFIILAGCSLDETIDTNKIEINNTKKSMIDIDKNSTTIYYETTYESKDLNFFLDNKFREISSPLKTKVLLVLHGTTWDNQKSLIAAKKIFIDTKKIIDNNINPDIFIISVAYPQEDMLVGDSIDYIENVYLWTIEKAEEELNLEIEDVYLFGHSLGGYYVTILNTMYETAGVIANAPGPLDLEKRCLIIEGNKQNEDEIACNSILDRYGSVEDNPQAYINRSLINYTSNHKSKILFIQGMNDKKIQLLSHEKFKTKFIIDNSMNKNSFIEIESFGHDAIFKSSSAIKELNQFLS
jgi:esterase/lipase